MKFFGIGKKLILITFIEWILTGFRVKISHCMALVLIDDMPLLEICIFPSDTNYQIKITKSFLRFKCDFFTKNSFESLQKLCCKRYKG